MESLEFFILLVVVYTHLLMMNHPLRHIVEQVEKYIADCTVTQSKGYIEVGDNIDYLNTGVLVFIEVFNLKGL